MRCLRVFALASFIFAYAHPVVAQQSVDYASVSGRLTDPSGAVVAGAQVVARQVETNVKADALTDQEGRFRFPYLRVGAYEITTRRAEVYAPDVAMLESEVIPVLKTLRKNDFDVVAIHHHMTQETPMVIFLHYWARGSADKLAGGFKSVLDELGKGTASRMSH